MARTLNLTENPIRVARKQLHLNIEQFAGQISIHYQAVYLNECGCYPNILPKIAAYLHIKGFPERELQKDYRKFQRTQRETFKQKHDLSGVSLASPDISRAPVESLIKVLGLSKMAFAKSICVQPAVLYQLSKGEYRHLPSQIEGALRDAGLDESLIEELNERTEEFYYSRK